MLDPQKASFANEVDVLQFLYDGLLKLDHQGNIQPGGADRWGVSPDGTQITFHIRDGLKRSEGTPILAEDYAYALRRAVDPRVKGKQYTAILYDIKGARDLDQLATQDPATLTDAQVEELFKNYGVTVPSPQVLVVTLDKPAAYWLYIATMWLTYPVDQHAVTSDPDTWWTKPENHVGNGPFVVSTISEGNKITYAANPLYWQGKPKLDRIETYYNPDNQVTLQAYQKGELDINANLAPEQVGQVERDAQLKNDLLRYPAAVTRAIAFNNSRRPFDDKNVRIAFSQAFDREGFVRDVLQGIGKPYTRWIPPGVPGAQPNQPGVPGTDPVAAVKTLVDNGYAAVDSTPDNPKVDCKKLGEMKLTYPSTPINHARSQFIAGNFVRVFGCPVTLDPIEATVFSALTKDVKTNPQISRQGWAQDFPHPQNWLSTYWVCGSFSRNYGYCNLKLDEILAQADATTNFEEAIKLYQQAEELMLSDVPAAFSNYDEYIYLARPYVLGPRDYPSSGDAAWPGQYGPVWEYDIDLASVPAGYPTQ
ncbi:MAG: peptide ABC transporter substrate-binding protein [Chloroflexi bacterium]|nr:peptide ABC transporter substrate-binding protein [Chloroflexota bacterium]